MPQYNIQTYMLAFTGLNGTIAGLAFAAIVFLLRGSPSGEELPSAQRDERDQALAVLVICVLAHLVTAAVAPAAAGAPSPTAQWIIGGLIVPVFIIGAANLFLSIFLLLQANSAMMPVRLFSRVLIFVHLLLTFYAFGFALSSAAVLGSWQVRPIELPAWVISLYVLAAIIPAAFCSLPFMKRRTQSLATRATAFEKLLSGELVFIAVIGVAVAITTVVQPLAIDRNSWLVASVAALAVTSTVLSFIRLWLYGFRVVNAGA